MALHAAGDWDWQLPAIVLPAVALGAGVLKVLDRTHGAPAAPTGVRWAVAAAAVAAIVMVVGPTISARTLDWTPVDPRTRNSGGGPRPRAGTPPASAPQDPAPRLLQANLLTDLGRPAEADAAFAAAVARSPHDWQALAGLGLVCARRNDDRAARIAARRAAELNPLEPRPRLILDRLDS